MIPTDYNHLGQILKVAVVFDFKKCKKKIPQQSALHAIQYKAPLVSEKVSKL
jgi:hypothetical protein